jgi:hypothetical protein
VLWLWRRAGGPLLITCQPFALGHLLNHHFASPAGHRHLHRPLNHIPRFLSTITPAYIGSKHRLTNTSSHILPLMAATNSPHLLALSGEIRNRILAFVLTSNDRTLNYTAKNEPKVSNQLQYVCKQLYHECHWLELKHNPSISFRSYAGDSLTATRLFLDFLAVIPPEKRQWIKDVELVSRNHLPRIVAEPPILDSKPELFHMADVCRYNPQINVHYRLPKFNSAHRASSPGYMYCLSICAQGIMYSSLLRSDDVDQPSPWKIPVGYHFAWGKSAIEWAGCNPNQSAKRRRDALRLRVPNLKFLLEADTIVDGMFDTMGELFSDEAQTHDLMPVYEKYIRKWMTEGV